MIKRCRWIIGLVCVLSFGLCGSEIYKWVDENGVVHYTDKPSENQQTTEVEIGEPPTAAEREEAEVIYQRAIEQTRSRKTATQQETIASRAARRERLSAMTPERVSCFEAYLAIQALETRGDVYQDEALKIHHWNSLHSFWYESYRKRLTDSEKRERIRRFEQEMDRYCDMPRREVRKRAGAWEKEQSLSQCQMAKRKLDRIKGNNGKTPWGVIDDIEELISEYCD